MLGIGGGVCAGKSVCGITGLVVTALADADNNILAEMYGVGEVGGVSRETDEDAMKNCSASKSVGGCEASRSTEITLDASIVVKRPVQHSARQDSVSVVTLN